MLRAKPNDINEEMRLLEKEIMFLETLVNPENGSVPRPTTETVKTPEGVNPLVFKMGRDLKVMHHENKLNLKLRVKSARGLNFNF